MNFRLFYHNPISGKLNFLYTHCVYCGKRVSLNRKNLGQNRFGDTFYYCNNYKKDVPVDLEVESIEIGPLSKNLKLRLKIEIKSSNRLICQICNQKIIKKDKIYLSGFGKVIEKNEIDYLKVSDINISHKDCICED